MPKKRALPKLVLKHLAESGLTEKDAARLGVTYINSDQFVELTENKKLDCDAYRLPYFNIDGTQRPFARYRILGDPGTGFGKAKGKEQKYWQPPDSGLHFYLPLFVDWRKVARDTNVPIYITEGEKKAARACKETDMPTIGLGGVWSWKASKKGLIRIPDFDLFSWANRQVIIVYDSDITYKPDVQRALNAIAEELTLEGAHPWTVKLPSRDGSKVGLDDYLQQHGIKKFKRLEKEPLLGGLAEALFQMNHEFALIGDQDAIYELTKNRIIRDSRTFTGVTCADRKVRIQVEDKVREFKVAAEWLSWPLRKKYTGLTYMPGQKRELDDGRLNTWPGWPHEPKKGDVKLFKKLVDYLLTGVSAEHKKWFWQWLAYPIQYPGTKLYTAVVLHGTAQGTGKSLLGYTLGKVYGQNFMEINSKQLHSDYNGWLANKQFIMGDEITGSDNRKDADNLKNVITAPMVEVNKKYLPQFEVPNLANFLFTSNHPDAFFLDPQDRRYFIHEVPGTPLSRKFYDQYDAWYQTPEAAAAIMWYLQNQVNLVGFNPRSHAPMTPSKETMMEWSLSSLDTWVYMLKDDPDEALTIQGVGTLKQELWPPNDLLKHYNDFVNKGTPVSPSGFGKAMHRAGLRNDKIKLSNGKAQRLYPIRNREKWWKASRTTWRDAYESGRGGAEGKGARVIPFPKGRKGARGENGSKKKF